MPRITLTGVAITAGIGVSLLKGGDYEEAALLAILLILLRQARPAFDRKTAFFETRFSVSWIAVVFRPWLHPFGLRCSHLNMSSTRMIYQRSTAEKGFSLGFFDREYLARFPIAVVEHEGRIEAFTNM
jgi:lysylphosphatidylglycerol synthetase-like protein (DUF2156 family)